MERDARLNQLTALRGIAAVLVVFSHAGSEWHPIFASGQRFSMLIASSWLWVHFFFVLSGFVMMHAYGEAFRRRVTTRAYLRFLFVRFGRIYPLYAVALAACVVAVHTGFTSFVREPGALRASFLLTQGFTYKALQWNYVGWSISTEWYTYLLFPLMAWSLHRLARMPAAWLEASTAIVAGLVVLLFVAPLETPLARLAVCFVEVLLGCHLHSLVATGRFPVFSSPAGLTIVALPIVLMALPEPFSSRLSDGLVATGFASAILVIANQHTPLVRPLGGRALQWLGRISYAVYLLHPLMFRCAQKLADTVTGQRHFIAGSPSATAVALFVPYLVALALVSWLAYRLVEEPARRAFRAAAGDRRRWPTPDGPDAGPGRGPRRGRDPRL